MTENDDYLLNLVKQFKTKARYKKFIWERNLPPLSKILNRFGSWNTAKKVIERSEYKEHTSSSNNYYYLEKSQVPCKVFLYLVYFYEEDFYKVGITTVGLSSRFKSYPKYKPIDKLLFSREEAFEAETYIKRRIKHSYRPKASNFRAGHTECFKLSGVFTLNHLLKGSKMAWTEEQEKELLNLSNEGLSVKEIAEVIDRPFGTVSNKCTRLGLAKMPRWTLEEEEKLISLSNEGHCTERLALRLGRTEGAIKQKLSRLIKEGMDK